MIGNGFGVAMRRLLGSMVLVLSLGLGLGLVAPQTAAAADLPLQVSISGDNTVYSWDYTLHIVKVKNANSVAVNDIFVQIYDYDLPIDYDIISCYVGSFHATSDCRIVDGLGMSSKTRATFSWGRLDPGQEITIYLYGRTTAVWGSGDALMRVKAYNNYPANTTNNGFASKRIAWNP